MVRQRFKLPNSVPSSPALEPVFPGSGVYGGFVPINDKFTPEAPGAGPIGYKVDLVYDNCNIGIQVTAQFLFIKFPSIQIVYRNLHCRFPKLPQPPDKQLPVPTSAKADNSCDVGINVGLINQNYYILHDEGYNYGLVHEERTQRVINWEYSYSEPLGQHQGFDYYFKAEIIADIDFQFNTEYQNAVWASLTFTLEDIFDLYTDRGWEIPGDWKTNARARWKAQKTVIGTYYFDFNLRLITSVFDDNRFETYLSAPSVFISNPEKIAEFRLTLYRPEIIKSSRRTTVRSKIQDAFFDSMYSQGELKLIEEGTDFFGKYYTYSWEFLAIRHETYEIFCSSYKFIPPPPPPDNMSCCPNVRENDELLRLIAKRLGVSDYPVNVPKILTDRSKGTESLENITRFTSYVVRQLDALSGKYPIEIEIKDTDITEAGDQTKKIKIPNMAEAVAEIIGELLVLRTESDAILNTVIRCLTEAGAAKQSAIIALDYAKANSEFLAYKGKQVIRKVPFTFKPGEPQLDKMLANSEVDVKTWENDDKEDFKDLVEPLLTMAAMYRAQNFRNLGSESTVANLKNILENINGFSSEIEKSIAENNQSPSVQSDFDAFTESAERGFTDKTGITDNTNPYGRPLDQRPKIREIGENEGTAP